MAPKKTMNMYQFIGFFFLLVFFFYGPYLLISFLFFISISHLFLFVNSAILDIG